MANYSVNGLELSVVSFLKDQKCWGVLAGSGTGSVFRLLFGDKIKRKTPLTNMSQDSKVREYDASISLFVECSWRLAADDCLICSCRSINKNDGPMVLGLKKLVGQVINSCVLTPTLDLTLGFTNGYILTIFNDLVSVGPYDCSFSIRKKDTRYEVSNFMLNQADKPVSQG